MKKQRLAVPALAAALALAAGCSGDVFSSAPGHYNGYVLIGAGAAAAAATGVAQTQVFVSADATAAGRALTLKTQAGDGSRSWRWQLTLADSSTLQLRATDGSVEPTTLKKTTESCFESGSGQAKQRVCFDGHELTASLSLLATADSGGVAEHLGLVLDRESSNTVPTLETPAAYTLSALVERAKARGFETSAEFEQVVQARLGAQNAMLDLLPHLTTNDVLNIASLNVLTVLKSAADLVPFLLPDRWYHALGAELRSDAELDAWLLMKADAAEQVAALSYAVVRDERVIERLGDNRLVVARVREEIEDKERSGLLQAGSSDDAAAVLNSIDQGVSSLQEALAGERASLARASGFYNPEAIASVTLDDSLSIVSPVTPVASDVTPLALERSLELQQTDALIEAAQMGQDERVFDWIDPSGDASGGLGVGIGDYVRVGASQVRELADQREGQQAALLGKVSDALGEVTQDLQSYGLYQDGSSIQQRRLERLERNLQLGVNFVLSDLVSSLQELSRNDVGQIDAEFAYYTLMSKLDRLTYSGSYADIPSLR